MQRSLWSNLHEDRKEVHVSLLQLPEEDGGAERRRVQQFPLLHQLQGPVAKLAGSGPSTLAVSVPDASREAADSLRWVRDHVMGLHFGTS